MNKWPKYKKEDLKLINQVILSGKVNYWTGKYCKIFEKDFSRKFGLKYSLTMANGSLALDAIVNILNFSSRDEVIVTPRSYISTASCLQSTKAKIKFVDVDINSQNITLKEIKKKINKNTKAIICTHLAGFPCDILPIKNFIKNKKIFLIEDCSQAHGAKISHRYVGSFGDFAVWSFCNDKIISTLGEGGMVACKSYKFMKKLWAYRDCGKNFDKIKKYKKNFFFKWLHDFKGTNLRMTEVQAVSGIQQLKRLEISVKKRNSNCHYIWNKIDQRKKIITATNVQKKFFHSGYRCYIFAKNKKIRDRIIIRLNKYGINANQGSCPEIYKEIRFSSNESNFRNLENAKILGNTALALPCHNLLSKKNLDFILEIINQEVRLILNGDKK